MMKTFFSHIFALLLVGILASCSNTTKPSTSTSSGLATKINMSKLPGWKGKGGEGIYICDEAPKCPVLKFGMYQTSAAQPTELAILRNVDKDPDAAKQQFKRALALLSSSQSGSLQIDGSLESVTANGFKGTGFYLKGQKADGSPRAPGYMMMYAGLKKIHVFVGITKKRAETKTIAILLSNAWAPKP